MADIDVAKPFKLTHDDGSVTQFPKGTHAVPDDIADHWYVKAHLVGAAPVQHPHGSPAALIAEGRAAQQAAAAAAVAEVEADAKARAALQTQAAAAIAERTAAAITTQAAAAEKAAGRTSGKGNR